MSTSDNSPPYHHGDLRRALVDEALRIVARDGVGKLGLRDLARAVGVSPAAPYRHFDGRGALLETLAVIGFQRFTRMMEALADTPAPERLNTMGSAYVQFALENANLFRLMFSAEMSQEQWPGFRMASEAAFQTLRAVSGEGPDARITALAAWAKVHGLATLLLDGQIAIGPDEEVAALVGQILARNPDQ